MNLDLTNVELRNCHFVRTSRALRNVNRCVAKTQKKEIDEIVQRPRCNCTRVKQIERFATQ